MKQQTSLEKYCGIKLSNLQRLKTSQKLRNKSMKNKIVKNLVVIVIVLVALIAVGCTGPKTDVTEKPKTYVTEEPKTDVTEEPKTNVCEWDWTFYTTNNIGRYYSAPSGYTYAIVSIYLNNKASRSVSTNAYNWEMTANSVTHYHDTTTYADEINHQSVDVKQGGSFKTNMVFLVTDETTQASLRYTGIMSPDMKQIDYFQSLREKSRKPTEEEKKELVLSELNDAGYNVDSIEVRMEHLNDKYTYAERETFIFNIPDVEYAKNIVEMSRIASKYYEPYGYMTYAPKNVDSNLRQSYWISKNDFNAYKYNRIELDEITVYSPNKQSKTMGDFLKMFD
ncbi:MAG TPA: DUF4352 domain-containing protein [Methanosarcinaceae archaeon]|nr:DUF4352 domain-containing protein [Methanosarcinaceae archaeon]